MRPWFRWRYWRWFWRTRVSRTDKRALAAAGCLLLGVGGYLTAFALTHAEDASALVTSERLITVVHKVPGGTSTQVETVTDTFVAKGETQLVTVMRNGREVTIALPAKTRTITDVETIDGKVVTNVRTVTDVRTRTDTQTQTTTVDRPTTVTQTNTVTHQETADPGTVTVTKTETETNDVPGPTTTVTDTETVTRTETETQTQTETVTETVTEPAP